MDFAEQDLSGSVAQVVRSGQVVAQAMVTRDGNYRIEGLEPGIYDMVISGSMVLQLSDSKQSRTWSLRKIWRQPLHKRCWSVLAW